MFAYPIQVHNPDQDPNNIPATQTYEPRGSAPGAWPAPVSSPQPVIQPIPQQPLPPQPIPQQPHHHHVFHDPFMYLQPAGQSFPMVQPYPAAPIVPGAYPQQCALSSMPHYQLYQIPYSMTMPFASTPGLGVGGGGAFVGGVVLPNPATGELVWYGRTPEEVASGNQASSYATGANTPNAEIMPCDPAEDDMFWVIELDGTKLLRTYMSISLSCQPGKWHQDAHGALYFQRHQPEAAV